MKVGYYLTPDGGQPIVKWLGRIKDTKAKAAIFARIARLQLGLFGDAKSLKDGVYELRVDVGAGYRVYYARSGSEVVILLCGGNKSSQDADIVKAKEYWNDYKKRSKSGE